MSMYNEYKIVSVCEYTEDCVDVDVLATVHSLEEAESFLNAYAEKFDAGKVSRYLSYQDVIKQGELYFRVESYWGIYYYSFF